MSKAPFLANHHHIQLSEQWELIQDDRDNLYIARIIGEDRYILEIGVSDFISAERLEEGINRIKSEGQSDHKEN